LTATLNQVRVYFGRTFMYLYTPCQQISDHLHAGHLHFCFPPETWVPTKLWHKLSKLKRRRRHGIVKRIQDPLSEQAATCSVRGVAPKHTSHHIRAREAVIQLPAIPQEVGSARLSTRALLQDLLRITLSLQRIVSRELDSNHTHFQYEAGSA